MAGGSLAGNVAKVATKEIAIGDALSNVARTATSTVGSLMTPSSPIVGYLIGASCADIAFAGRGTGIVLTINDEKSVAVGALHMLGAA